MVPQPIGMRALEVNLQKGLPGLLKKYWQSRDSNPGQLGEKQECYLSDMQPPPPLSKKMLVGLGPS